MKRFAKTLVGMATAFGLVVCVAIGEEWLRDREHTAIFIAGTPIHGTRISGASKPDFLWAGRAWWIDIHTDKPLLLTLDQWTGRIPVGVHRVFSNHDHTNTGQYGNGDFWGFPKSVSVREMLP